MFDRILVPLDGGPRGELALRAAEQLSRAWSAPLDVLGLVEVGSTVYNQLFPERLGRPVPCNRLRAFRWALRDVRSGIARNLL